MLLFTRLLRSPALALCLSTTAAQADLTAADLWTEWRDYASSTGYYISAREVTDSDGLTLNNLSMRMDLEETSGKQYSQHQDGYLTLYRERRWQRFCGAADLVGHRSQDKRRNWRKRLIYDRNHNDLSGFYSHW